ncbi:protein prenylyltransferase [Linderina pennispora]|uniref:Geranylgeranyl transferase type-2 subunit alpha n=1 Tax=Linderina pennispora TaxID=61395 RepID=A0A1Y1W4P1_9FUNG|nr:protein prenylyltransferase [Linderina pennispora]ORX68358.1 protein prenylyltransferase [Linderina pennispora]
MHEESRQKVASYCALNNNVFSSKAASVFTHETLDLTTRLLKDNTELHTIWNYRRDIFTHLPEWTDLGTRQTMLEGELQFLLELIKSNIKSYWMWNQRVWALTELPKPNWELELGLVAKLLALDARNYHGWDYRRYVVSMMKKSGADPSTVDHNEFVFTTDQINRDCANRSAWHNRSKLLPAELERSEDREGVLATEMSMIMNAIYTDPEDQNAWLYHEWLLDIQESDGDRNRLLRDKIAAIRELLELEESKRPLIELVDAFVALDMLDAQAVTGEEKRECMDILERLKSMDSYHRRRYQDLETQLRRQWNTSN